MSHVPDAPVDEDGFRPCGIGPSRIDAFSDVVFLSTAAFVVKDCPARVMGRLYHCCQNSSIDGSEC